MLQQHNMERRLHQRRLFAGDGMAWQESPAGSLGCALC